MPRQEFFTIMREMLAWWSSESEEFKELVLRILASFPGGDRLQDLGYKPLSIGWKEIYLLSSLLVVIENSRDVFEVAVMLENEIWRQHKVQELPKNFWTELFTVHDRLVHGTFDIESYKDMEDKPIRQCPDCIGCDMYYREGYYVCPACYYFEKEEE